MKKSGSAQFEVGTNSAKARRLLKMKSLIQAELGRIMTRELELPRQVLLTITKVEVPVDYSQAKTGLSVIPFIEADRVLGIVEAKRGELQRLINQRLHTYRVPKLVFYLDDVGERADSINRLLDKLS